MTSSGHAHLGRQRHDMTWSCHSWTGVGRRREFGVGFCTERTVQLNNFEFIPTVKMETSIIPYREIEFPSKLWTPEVARRYKLVKNFGVLFGKIFKILFRTFSSRHRSTCCVQISLKSTDGKSVKSYVIYQTKNFACLSNSRYCTDRTQNLPEPAADNVLRMIQIIRKSVYFRRSYSRTRERREIAP